MSYVDLLKNPAVCGGLYLITTTSRHIYVDFYEKVVVSHLEAAGKHALAEEFALDDTFAHVASAFPPARRAMNHTVREYLSLGA